MPSFTNRTITPCRSSFLYFWRSIVARQVWPLSRYLRLLWTARALCPPECIYFSNNKPPTIIKWTSLPSLQVSFSVTAQLSTYSSRCLVRIAEIIRHPHCYVKTEGTPTFAGSPVKAMCNTKHLVYTNCRYTITRITICQAHIDHTRLQLDDAPCPSHTKDIIQMRNPLCNCEDIDTDCQMGVSGKTDWAFERGDEVKKEWKR